MTKILSIVWYKVLPPRFGGQKGTALFNKYLVQHFPLVCLCSSNNNPPLDLSYKLVPELPVTKFQFIDPSCWFKILNIAKKEKITHLILEHPYHGIAGWLVKKFSGIKVIVHSHNIESERFREQGKWWWWILRILEKWAHRNAELNFFKTGNDMSFAIKHFKLNPAKCTIIPFGIEISETRIDKKDARKLIMERHSILPGDKIILFAGTLDYQPNADAVESIYKKIAPGLLQNQEFNFKIVICGRNNFNEFQYLKDLKNPQIIYAGEVNDISTYFAAADVFINPVRVSSGTQTKVIEAISYQLNTVVFRKQLEGIHILVCYDKIYTVPGEDWNEFNKQIINASKTVSPTPEVFFEYYNWNRIGLLAVQAIDQL